MDKEERDLQFMPIKSKGGFIFPKDKFMPGDDVFRIHIEIPRKYMVITRLDRGIDQFGYLCRHSLTKEVYFFDIDELLLRNELSEFDQQRCDDY